MAFSEKLFAFLSATICIFILFEVNYPVLTPQSELAIFALLGFILLFLKFPIAPNNKTFSNVIDGVLILFSVGCFGYVIVQNEPIFQSFWINGQPLGNRAGAEATVDYWIGLFGLLLVFEATRRCIGWTLPLLALAFISYAAFGSYMPEWLFPHRGYNWERIVSQVFLHSQGVFGIALHVMFTYVFLFVLFGTLLSQTGATDFVIQFARRIFKNSPGGAAKVAVLSSGLMGSLSGSAVANTATTGTFTIPMMRSSGFSAANAGGIEAAASSGGALVPPIMGAGAYMMLEIIEPTVTYLEIIRAALIPAVLYYLSLLLIVHFLAKKRGVNTTQVSEPPKLLAQAGWIFFSAFFVLILLLVIGFTPFRAVSVSLPVILLVSLFHPKTRINVSKINTAMVDAAKGGIALIAASACVGIIIGVVTLTGVGSKLPSAILPLAENNLLLALGLLMISTIILGMGLPSAVCYLLMATLIGPALGDLGIVPLAAHLFIFYFGMMSMVTPPVALAAYTASAIAKSGIMETAFAAFKFALIGFILPFVFVLHPEILMLTPNGDAAWIDIIVNTFIAIIGVLALAAAVVGFWYKKVTWIERGILTVAAAVLLLSASTDNQWLIHGTAIAAVLVIGIFQWRNRAKLSTEIKA